MNAMEEKHLTIETKINGVRVGMEDINDPFLHNRTTIEMSLWDRVKFLFTGKILFEVKVRGDIKAHRQWFRTDEIPGSSHGEEEAAQAVQDASNDSRRPPTVGTER